MSREAKTAKDVETYVYILPSTFKQIDIQTLLEGADGTTQSRHDVCKINVIWYICSRTQCQSEQGSAIPNLDKSIAGNKETK